MLINVCFLWQINIMFRPHSLRWVMWLFSSVPFECERTWECQQNREVWDGRERHLLRLVRHGRPLLGPRLPLAVHLSLQLLQTPLHARRHLQTTMPEITQTSPVSGVGGMAAGCDKWDNRKLKGWLTKKRSRLEVGRSRCKNSPSHQEASRPPVRGG